MVKQAVYTKNAPAGRSYSQAVVVGDLVFVAGTAGKDMSTGSWPVGVEAQMEQALANVSAILAEVGCTLDDVVKTTTFITPEAYSVDEEADKAEEAYRRAFSGARPARSSPMVTLPVPAALVSIEAIAVIPASG